MLGQQADFAQTATHERRGVVPVAASTGNRADARGIVDRDLRRAGVGGAHIPASGMKRDADLVHRHGLNPVDVYAQALSSRRLRAVDDAGQDLGMGLTRWLDPASRHDDILLAHCTRNTLDVGCGPGRLSAALTESGVGALGIDVSPEAVEIARGRGATALRRDVFCSVPGQGRWPSLLLADGNIGIGGNPAALLGRVRAMLAPGGRAVVEVDPPGEGVSTRLIRLEVDDMVSAWFPWARVAADSISDLARVAGLIFAGLDQREDRWVALLDRRS